MWQNLFVSAHACYQSDLKKTECVCREDELCYPSVWSIRQPLLHCPPLRFLAPQQPPPGTYSIHGSAEALEWSTISSFRVSIWSLLHNLHLTKPNLAPGKASNFLNFAKSYYIFLGPYQQLRLHTVKKLLIWAPSLSCGAAMTDWRSCPKVHLIPYQVAEASKYPPLFLHSSHASQPASPTFYAGRGLNRAWDLREFFVNTVLLNFHRHGLTEV